MSVWQSATLVGGGAALGAILRWGTGLWLNPLLATLSFGTLIVNWLGCFLIGIFTALIWQFPQFPSEWRLFFITGFLGSFTTFSAFSAEVIENFLNRQWANGWIVIVLHLIGSLVFTWLGIYCSKGLR